jgi:predicted DNA-binding ribbon-helix-helix protein
MSDGVVKRSVSIAGHRTSVSLEEPFWDALRLLAERRGISVQSLIGSIDARRGEQNLSSAIRVHVLGAYRDALGRLSAQEAGEPR